MIKRRRRTQGHFPSLRCLLRRALQTTVPALVGFIQHWLTAANKSGGGEQEWG